MCQKIFDGFKFFFILTLFFSFPDCIAQKTEFRGTVRDATTHKPIPFATIFLASTSFGASADEEGVFVMNDIPPGKYDIIISSLGFHKLSYSLEFPTTNKQFAFELQPDVRELKTVVVEANERLRKKYYKTFLKWFLGTTPNAFYCHIENPDDIYFDYTKGVLSAECATPVIVVNKALGYKVHFLLDEFKFDEQNQTLRVFGVPRFEELLPESESQSRKWKKAREASYHGSLTHFMSSLLHRKLEENDFILTTLSENSPLLESTFFADTTTSKFNYKGRLSLYYTAEAEDYYYSRSRSQRQRSLIHFLDPSLTIYENGYFERYKSVELEGYLAWSTCLAELVPLEYKPSTSPKRKL
jgi:hypothetical protein